MKRILAAVDTSEISKLVLERAVELALATGAKVRLFHAFSPVPPPPMAGALVPFEDQSALIESAQQVLNDMLESVPQGTRDGAIVEIGSAAHAVCEAARSYDADVVVIGAHKHGVIARVLGTTAARIVNGIDRQLLVVRPPPSHEVAATKASAAKSAAASPSSASGASAPGRAHREHTFLETGTLAGAAGGAAVGAMAGPPGVVLGGALGAGIGMLAGGALDNEARRASEHDRALDDVIGVTQGDLGARERAASGMTALDKTSLGAEVLMTNAAVILKRDHGYLETVYINLLRAYRDGDWADVRLQWDAFDSALRAHMQTEEKRVLPCFRSVNVQEASELLAEHDELRRQLDAFGVRVDLHAFTISDADELIGRVRAHAAREEKLLYPWFDEEVAGDVASGPSEVRPTVKRESPARRPISSAEAKM
jgi:nucleotide-binding universal stress UspA family protein